MSPAGARHVFTLVEGQTEEVFVRTVLAPHLMSFGLHMTPIIVATRRVAAGGKYRGGISTWAKVQHDLRGLLGASHVVAVTTLLDLYGLRADWPGMDAACPAAPRAKVAHLEQSMDEAIGDRRFVPHLMLHEFEALLFAAPEACDRWAGVPGLEQALRHELAGCGDPELLDDGPTTAPSKRLARCWPTYAKTVDGPGLAAEIGLPRLRTACRHFDKWVSRLEAL